MNLTLTAASHLLDRANSLEPSGAGHHKLILKDQLELHLLVDEKSRWEIYAFDENDLTRLGDELFLDVVRLRAPQAVPAAAPEVA